ncbi:hypothetical protein VTI74DRAFT_9493 [Chaetomium olivicolor]
MATLQVADCIPLARFTSIGLGLPLGDTHPLGLGGAVFALTLRTGMVVLGVTCLIYGVLPDQFQTGVTYFKGLDWKRVSIHIVRAAECSRWFFTVVTATRDLYKRW